MTHIFVSSLFVPLTKNGRREEEKKRLTFDCEDYFYEFIEATKERKKK